MFKPFQRNTVIVIILVALDIFGRMALMSASARDFLGDMPGWVFWAVVVLAVLEASLEVMAQVLRKQGHMQ